MIVREPCGGCGSGGRLEKFLDLGSSPVADILPASADEKQERYPLQLVVCRTCWLVQMKHIVPDGNLYNSDYAYYTGVSKAPYHKQLARQLTQDWGPFEFVVEIGSNDGDLLQHFADPKTHVLGVDPSSGPAEVARDRGVETIVEPFTEPLGRHIAGRDGKADLIIANHVAAHVYDLHDFFAGVKALLSPTGVASLEVQYVGDLLTGNQFDNVYHQHRYFFSIDSLDAVVRQHGMQIIRAQHVDAQGGSISVAIAHQRGLYPSQLPQEGHGWLQDWSAYSGLQGRVERVRERLLALLEAEKQASRRVVGYGAAAKATTLLNFCGIDKHLVAAIEDTTPYKIGRFMPGTQIPICKPGDQEADTYLVTVWNYLPKILRQETSFLAAGGRMIVPIPMPMLLGAS